MLIERSGNKCELCGAADNLSAFEVTGKESEEIFSCTTCQSQMNTPDTADANHWRCLNDSMWSQVPAVQIMSYRMLSHLSTEPWAQDLLDMMYLDDEALAWAQSGIVNNDEDTVAHKDSNGAILEAGDTVSLIKDLDVKGANFTAKRGTAVRNISLVSDNTGHIEGKVEGQRIVILTKFVKKQG